MKRGTPRHPKLLELSAELGLPVYSCVGLLELLWHFTAEFALDGGIGKFSDEAIGQALHYDGDIKVLLQALITTRWIDRCRCHRLRIHDWHIHADKTVKAVLVNRKQVFAECYHDSSMIVPPCSDDSSLPLPLPLPLPDPMPMPIPKATDKDRVSALVLTPSKPQKKKLVTSEKKEIQKAKSTDTWNAYSAAYQERYRVIPARGAKNNKLLCDFIEIVGEEEAPQIAAYYLQSRNYYYVQRGHPISCLLSDCQKIRTEWLTGEQITSTGAREQDRLAKDGQDWQKMIDRAEAKERANEV